MDSAEDNWLSQPEVADIGLRFFATAHLCINARVGSARFRSRFSESSSENAVLDVARWARTPESPAAADETVEEHHSAHSSSSRNSPNLRRNLVRVFVALSAACIAIQTLPAGWPWVAVLKPPVQRVLDPIGIWQGEWPLFAPDPIPTNAWLTAEIYAPDGSLEFWNSTYWADASGYEKFRRFRFMNYYTRAPINGQAAIDDFCDYLASQEIGPNLEAESYDPEAEAESQDDASRKPAWRIRLYKSELKQIDQPDLRLPSRDEAISVASSKILTDRKYWQP